MCVCVFFLFGGGRVNVRFGSMDGRSVFRAYSLTEFIAFRVSRIEELSRKLG